ncbi:MAG: DUF4129 domain-containing protein [Planctomycetes bacterium]|nr:DUF4129 domain-containing protein [Planctomycetota bacterium]
MPWLRGSLLCLCLGAAAAQDPQAPPPLRESLRAHAERVDAQTELPGDQPAAARRRPRSLPPDSPSVPHERTGVPREAGARSGELPSGAGRGDLARAFAWTLVAAVAVLLAIALARALAERRRRAAIAAPKPRGLVLPPAAAPPPLADFERLPAAGRFADAVHALLLHAFVALAERRGAAWPAAQTGREILASLGGFQDGGLPLRTVFRVAETAWFGRAPVDRAGYEDCLRCYRDWRGA